MNPIKQTTPPAQFRSNTIRTRHLLFKYASLLAISLCFPTAVQLSAASQTIVTGGTITTDIINQLSTNDTLTVSGSVNFAGTLAMATKSLTITAGESDWATITGPFAGEGVQNRFTVGAGATTWTFDRISITGGGSANFGGAALAAIIGSTLTTVHGDFKLLRNSSKGPNANNSGGGAINAVSGTMRLTGNVEIYENTVNASTFNNSGGGGINISNANGSIELGDEITYSISPKTVYIHHNTATGNNTSPVRGQGGGVRSSGFAKFVSDVIIASNTAGGNGGGMYVAKAFTMANSTLFADNISAFDGGALYAAGNVISSGVFTATANTAAGAGGAIYLMHTPSSTVAFSGGSRFIDNRAGTTGGAIHWYNAQNSVMQLNADTGDIIFQGNTANGVANAMHIDPAANRNNTIAVTAAPGKTVAFYDPITTGTNANTKLFITVSGQGGSLLFDRYTSPVAAITTVNTGAALRLSNNAILGAGTAAGSLTLKTGAVLSGAGTIRTGTLALENNSLLEARHGGTLKIEAGSINAPEAIRLAGHGTINIASTLTASRVTVGVTSLALSNTAQTLTLTSATPLTLADGGMINIDLFANGTHDLLTLDKLTLAGTGAINLAGSGSGAFKILTAANTDLSALGLVRLVNGGAPTARVTADLRYENSGHELWVDFASRNLITTWTGSNGRTWQSSTDITDANWNDAAASDFTFEFGDSVKFTSAGAGTVTISDNGVIAADMTVDATADYTFDGAGGITTDVGSSFGITEPLTGKLIKKGAGTLNFTNTGINTFANGIDIAGGVISFTSADQITTTGTSISFVGAGTLRAAASGLTMNNTLDIAASAAGSIDVRQKDDLLTYSGILRGGDTATLNKIGAGNLVFTAGNAAVFTGTVNIAAGRLSVASTGALGGKTVVQNGAILAGNGLAGAGAAGSVTVLAGGIIEAGMPGATAAQTLRVNNLSVNGARLLYDLFAENASDRISATGAPINVGATGNTIVLATFQTGTFNLGNLAALNGKVTVSEIGGMSPRHSGTLSVSGNDLILETTGDKSRALTWTGSSNATWDYSSNWLESGTALQFASGDAITFDSASDTPARRNISLNTAPVRVTAITVQGNADYTFTGSNGITADPSSNILDGIAAPTGKLVKSGNGTLTFANTAANNFLGGIEISGGNIAFANSGQLGDGGNGITFTGTGGLAPTASTTLTNDLTINANARATLATGNNSLTYTGVLTAGAATATLAKTGTGTLTLSGNDNSAYIGTTSILAGHLVLDNNARLGGNVTLANATTLSGNGVLTGSVNLAAGSALQVGDGAAPGMLAIGTLSLANNTTLLGSGSLALTNGTLSGLVTANIAAATNISISGALAGTGTLSKTGGGSLIYTSLESLGYNTTIINDGFVMFRGITDLSTGTHNIFLNGGWLDLSDAPVYNPDGSTANNWRALNITGTLGGIIGANDMITLRAGDNNLTIGTIDKPGIFVAVDAGEGNTATISGSSAYVGYTRLDSGILKVDADWQLGDLAANRNVVFNGGNLRISGSFDTARSLEVRANGTLIADEGLETAWTSISGSTTAILTKTGAGTLINKGPSNIAGVHVEQGRFVSLVTNGVGIGSGTSTVASGAVIEMRGIGDRRTLDTNIVGSGTLLLNSSTMAVSGNNDMAHVVISRSAISVSSRNGLGTRTGSITMDADSGITVSATISEFGRLALNQGQLAFATPIRVTGTGDVPDQYFYRQSTIGNLQGGGVIRMNVNFTNASGLAAAGTKADFIVVSAGSGTYTLNISTVSQRPSNPLSSFDLIDSGSSGVTFELFRGIYEVGTNRYRLTQGYGDPYAPDPTHWYLVYNTLSNTAEAILNTAATANIDWFITMDSVTQRLGDIRDNLTDAREQWQSPRSFKSSRIGDTWIRTRGYQLNATNQYTERDFQQFGGGVSAGIDRAFKTENTAILAGLFIDSGLISRNFKDYGSGNTYTLTAGLYGTWMHENGLYADLVLAGSTYGQKFSARTTYAGTIDGKYQNTILGATVEFGYRIKARNGWWFEPAIQGGFAGITGATYDTSPDSVGVKSHVILEDQNAWQYRGLLRVGHKTEGSRWTPYMKIAAVSTNASGGEIYADDRKFAPDYDGYRYEAGFGTTYNLGRLSQLYFDYEYAKSSDYERPWSINLGIRYLW